jgi:ferrous iron transport protein A
MRSLHTLRPGSRARLIQVGGERSFRRRLMELGLLPGTLVDVVRNVDVGGVMELEVRRCRVTLRRREAQELFVADAGAPE